MIHFSRPDVPPLNCLQGCLERMWQSRQLTNNGIFVRKLERRLEAYLRVDNLVLVQNGTLAIQLIVKVLGLTGEVITTPFTFAATTNALLWQNLRPVFADVDSETFNIDPESVEARITEKTSAILAVHTYGNPCHVDQLSRIGKKNKLKVIFDAAQAFGVEYRGRSVLTFGDSSALSLHATKVFNTVEGGAIITNRDADARNLKLLRNFGIRSEMEIALPGINAKMNEVEAAVGLCNLRRVRINIARRKALYVRYVARLSDSDLAFQRILASRYNYSYMPIVFHDARVRAKAQADLFARGIESRR